MDRPEQPVRAPVASRRASQRERERSFHFSAGDALATSFKIFGRHLPILVGLAALFHGVPTLLELKQAEIQTELFQRAVANQQVPGFFDSIGGVLGLVTILASWVLPLAFHAVVTFAVFRTLRGESPRYGESLGRGLKRLHLALGSSFFVALALFVPMFILLMFLGGLGGLAGGLLGLVGGLVYVAVMACTWFVSVQTAVVEAADPFKSMSRSAHLTRGARGGIFGIVLVAFLLPAILNWIAQKVVLPPPQAFVVDTTRIFLEAGFNVLFAGLQAVATVVVYHALRKAKEGVGVDELLAVFD